MSDELLDQFLVEGRELTQSASDDLLALERAPGDAARLDSAFRAIHTLKGSVALFDLAPLSLALHAAEDLMGALRDGILTADRAVTDALLACIGAAEDWIQAFGRAGVLPPQAAAEAEILVRRMRGLLGAEPVEAPAPSAGAAQEPAWLTALRAASPAGATVRTALRYTPRRDCFFMGDDPMALIRSVPGLAALDVAVGGTADLAAFDPFACTLVIDALSTAPTDEIRRLFRFVSDQVVIAEVRPNPDPPAAIAEAAPASRSLRIDAARLDAVADLVGELIVAKNRLAHLAAATAAAAPALGRLLAANHADIERLVGGLHRAVDGARLVPLDQTFRRLPRLLREVSGRLGKAVRLDIEGAGTAADKTIVDGLFEPLLHVLRNAVDHGMEDAAARARAGKPAAGCIVLRAGQSGGRIVVTVSDDGAGIDPAALRRTAATRGLAPQSVIDALDDAAALELIFSPGFSTAASVTDVSGRGVGLDVVRSALRALGGAVTIASEPGRGTTVTLTVPQSVSVTTIVVVTVGGERFGAPIERVAETVRIPRDRIAPIRDGAAFALRDRTVPFLRLCDLLQIPAAEPPPREARLLVALSGEDLVGIEVDGFGERMEVVLRPLGGLLAGARGMLGTALLGDGMVLMILDLAALIG